MIDFRCDSGEGDSCFVFKSEEVDDSIFVMVRVVSGSYECINIPNDEARRLYRMMKAEFELTTGDDARALGIAMIPHDTTVEQVR